MPLLRTRLRRRLLGYSFTHPGEEHYVRELALLIGEDPGNLSRELKKLEAEGLYISRAKGNQKYYSLNSAYPLYAELKSIISKTEGVEGSLSALVGCFETVSCAFIYGSFASGRETAGSDIDLVIVGSVPRAVFMDRIRELESRLNREINYTVYSEAEFRREKARQGGFLAALLEQKLLLLKGTLDNG